MAFIQSGKRPLQAPESSLTNCLTASGNGSSSIAEQEYSTGANALNLQLYDMFSGVIALCWDHNPGRRPSFGQIILELHKMVQVMHSSSLGKQQLASEEGLGRSLVVVIPVEDQETIVPQQTTPALRH